MDKFKQDLISAWKKILDCQDCDRPNERYGPQFRPVGENYRRDGICFLLDRPSAAGCEKRDPQDPDEERLNNLLELQHQFRNSPSTDTWEALNRFQIEIGIPKWGQPVGIYLERILAHLPETIRSLDNVALLELAQCPIPRNHAHNGSRRHCFNTYVKGLLEILRPKVVITMGSAVKNILLQPGDAYSFFIAHSYHPRPWAVADATVLEAQRRIREFLTR